GAAVEDDRALGGAERLVERGVQRDGVEDRRALGGAGAAAAPGLANQGLPTLAVPQVPREDARVVPHLRRVLLEEPPDRAVGERAADPQVAGLDVLLDQDAGLDDPARAVL